MKEKYRDVENAIRVCNTVMSDKDAKIDRLEKELETARAVDSSGISIDSAASAQKFMKSSTHFSSGELATLRSFGPGKREDSTFVSAGVRALYADNLDAVKTKSLTGRSKSEQKKNAMTPEKREILKEILTERVHSTTGDDEERKTRIKKLNDHIRFAIINISKKIQSENVENAVCERLADSAK